MLKGQQHESGASSRWVAVALLVVVAGLFSFRNAGERVSVDLGFTTLYRISLVGIVFAAFLLGMIAMFLFGLRYDRKVREVLRHQAGLRSSQADPPYSPPPHTHDLSP